MELTKLLAVAKRYDLVVGDKFEMFYRGIIMHVNPYKFYIHCVCTKGHAYPRYYTYTPKEGEEGDYELKITLYDDYHREMESATTTLHVESVKKPAKKINILCFGDSLTVNGVWPSVGYERISEKYPNMLNFIGNMKKGDVGFEGYGGWKWKEFCDDSCIGMSSSVWIECDHHFDENDQHSVWYSNDKLWVLETIEEKRVKFKRGTGNFTMSRNIGEVFTHVEGGIHHDELKVKSFDYELNSPFCKKGATEPDFKYYLEKGNFETPDLVYILLSWNGQYTAFDTKHDNHDPYIRLILRAIHKDLPSAKIGLIGIQSPAINGGIAANYGCYGVYSDLLGDIVTAYDYDMYLERLTEEDEFKDYCRYIDMKAQFDVENNTPETLVPVNARSKKMEMLGTNGVHPTMEGYLQIGDCFYRALVSDINKIK